MSNVSGRTASLEEAHDIIPPHGEQAIPLEVLEGPAQQAEQHLAEEHHDHAADATLEEVYAIVSEFEEEHPQQERLRRRYEQQYTRKHDPSGIREASSAGVANQGRSSLPTVEEANSADRPSGSRESEELRFYDEQDEDMSFYGSEAGDNLDNASIGSKSKAKQDTHTARNPDDPHQNLSTTGFALDEASTQPTDGLQQRRERGGSSSV